MTREWTVLQGSRNSELGECGRLVQMNCTRMVIYKSQTQSTNIVQTTKPYIVALLQKSEIVFTVWYRFLFEALIILVGAVLI